MTCLAHRCPVRHKRATRALALQVTAGLEMSTGVSEAKKDEQHPLERVREMTVHTWQGWAYKGAPQHVDYGFAYG